MTSQHVITTSAPKIGLLGAVFYFHPSTMARAKELGLDGFRMYFLGRGGVLGDVEPPVVTSAFGYFHPALVAKVWNSARERMAPREAAREYLACCHALARERLAGVEGLDAFCDAAAAIDDAADPAGLALYAGYKAEPRPDDAAARALHLVTVLRELRGSTHLLAIVASGLPPSIAHYLRRPNDYGTFGWGEEAPGVTGEHRAKLERADRLTDELLVPSFSVLDGDGARAFLDGLEAIERAFSAA
jgi:hypothetical protein